MVSSLPSVALVTRRKNFVGIGDSQRFALEVRNNLNHVFLFITTKILVD